MSGKVLKVAINDLYGTPADRDVTVYAVFTHTKYMENYAIFTFNDEVDKTKLCYASIHIKDDTLITFAVKDNIKPYIDAFIEENLSDKLDDYTLIDVTKLRKIQLVSYSEMVYDDIPKLKDKAIEKPVIEESKKEIKKKNKYAPLYVVLALLILTGAILTVFYLRPDLFTVKYKELVCTNTLYDSDLEMYYDITKDIKYGKKDKLVSINTTRTYKFTDITTYEEFKTNGKEQTSFNNNGTYKYLDDTLSLAIMYSEESVIDDYDEMYTYLTKEAYVCSEETYEK